MERGEQRERDIRSLSKVHFKLLDLSSFATIKRFCSQVLVEEPRIDALKQYQYNVLSLLEN